MDQLLQMMIPDTPTDTPIATLVFMDLETTGLPNFIGKKNVNITEMSLVAMDRSNFENENTTPRVLNKLSICVQPRTVISFGAMEVTGLCNDILETQHTFDESIPKLLDAFFSRLRKPICLLAHNGKCYDFPVLQAELKRLDYSLPENILCADTLEAFRKMGLVPPNNSHSINTNVRNGEEEEITDEVVEKLLNEDMWFFRKIDMLEEIPIIKTENYLLNNESKEWECCNSCAQNTDQCLDDILSILENGRIQSGYGEKTPSRSNLSTPPNSQYYAYGRVTEITPHFQSSCKSISVPMISTNACSKVVGAKRKLFEPSGSELNKSVRTNMPDMLKNSPLKHVTIKQAPKRQSYALDKLYIHYFGELPSGHHHAESDCINLSKICQNVSKSFLPWLDKNNKPFCLTSPLW